MFTVSHRDATSHALVAMAEEDGDIAGAAFVGSSATGEQDAWSDIDLMLRLAPNIDVQAVIDRWTNRLYADFGVAHHLDVIAGNGVVYRVFLTTDSLQMDISFWPYDEFRASGDRFRLIFGESNPPTDPAKENANALIGMGWLFAIHVRSALAREQWWYALSLMDTMLIRIMTLASIRHGLNPHQRREVDKLPVEFLNQLQTTRASSLDAPELRRAFAAMMRVFQAEMSAHDPSLAESLAPALNAIINAEEGMK